MVKIKSEDESKMSETRIIGIGLLGTVLVLLALDDAEEYNKKRIK